MPLMRAMTLMYPEIAEFETMTQQYMLGESFLLLRLPTRLPSHPVNGLISGPESCWMVRVSFLTPSRKAKGDRCLSKPDP